MGSKLSTQAPPPSKPYHLYIARGAHTLAVDVACRTSYSITRLVTLSPLGPLRRPHDMGWAHRDCTPHSLYHTHPLHTHCSALLRTLPKKLRLACFVRALPAGPGIEPATHAATPACTAAHPQPHQAGQMKPCQEPKQATLLPTTQV